MATDPTVPPKTIDLRDGAEASHRPRYKNPPVIEALVFIKVAPSTVSIATLEHVIPAEPITYPKRSVVSASGITINLSNPKETTSVARQIGYKYASEDSTRVVQVRGDGFVFSRLPPYPNDGWLEWTPEARRLWDAYRETVKPQKVTQLQVRYANRIRIPALRLDPEDYFNTYPAIAKNLPDTDRYMLRLEFPDPHIEGARLVINQGTLYDPGEPATASILLDLEVSKEVELEAQDPEIWQTLETLHICESDAFEACLTQKSRDLFNQ